VSTEKHAGQSPGKKCDPSSFIEIFAKIGQASGSEEKGDLGMSQTGPVFQELTVEDFDKIKSMAVRQECKKGERIFSEGDTADYIYFIESGRVSIFIQKFTVQEEIGVLGPGEYFGEMAFFYKDKRTASDRKSVV
jgi:hypothetical protein